MREGLQLLAASVQEDSSNLDWLIPVKGVLYVAAFWFLGFAILKKRALPSLGWAVLGGLARWIAGVVLGIGLALLLMRLEPPVFVLVLALAALRGCLWFGLAAFLYTPPVRIGVSFAAIMTVVNFAIDVLAFGLPSLSDLGSTWRHPWLH